MDGDEAGPAARSADLSGKALGSTSAERYLDLLKGCLTRDLFVDERWVDLLDWEPNRLLADPDSVSELLASWGARLQVRAGSSSEWQAGRVLPATAETMIGKARLDNVHELVRRAVTEGVPGDMVETGVWRGGVIAFMRAAIEAYGDVDRLVWACDSYDGLPRDAGERFDADRGLRIPDRDPTERFSRRLAVPLEVVQANIARYGLLDDRIRFVIGWFRDTLPLVPIERIAVLRLDGDLYESTWDALTHLEPRVTPGGFVIIDDYGGLDVCRLAVDDYRCKVGIESPIHSVDWTAVWWRKDPVPS